MAYTAEIGRDLALAANFLRNGQLVGMPTETVYGLAGNALNPEAVAAIFSTKQRPAFDPLIMHLPNVDRVRQYVEDLPKQAIQLANAFWPGPLTMVFKRKAIVPDLVTAGLDTVAVRVPAHPMAQALLEQLDFPLAAPSANPFGYISPTQPEHVQEQLGTKIPYVLDGGPCQIGLESTIVSFTGDEPVLLRKGGLAVESIAAVLGQEVKMNLHSSSNPQAPGMLAKHYAPKTAFYLLDDDVPIQHFAPFNAVPPSRRALLTFAASEEVEGDVFDLSERGSLPEAANKLFATLRSLDAGNYQVIVAKLVPEQGLGLAINDRLRRAAAK